MEELHYDEPIVTAEQDTIGREPLVSQCADVLASVRCDTSFVVGLSGTWGSGKTSFVNLVKERLRSSKHPPIVIDFNPWLYSSHEQLLREFFTEVNKAIGVRGGGRLGEAIADYSDILAEAGTLALSSNPGVASLNATVPLAKKAEKFGLKRFFKSAGKALTPKEKTLAETRDTLKNELAKLESNIVIVMDDVDRLSNDEIRLLFRFVTLVASFPRVAYLLAYDLQVVCGALDGMQGREGMRYLEKIVQLPIELPPIRPEVIDAQLRTAIESSMGTITTRKIDGVEKSRFAQVYQTLVLGSVTTPRGIKRYANKLSSVVGLLGEEICPTDLLGMTAVSLRYPNIHQWVWANRGELCGTSLHLSDGDSAWAKDLLESLARVAKLDATNCSDALSMLSLMFPEAARWSNPSHPRMRGGVPRTSGRVAHIRNSELYFGSLDVGEMTRPLMQELMVSADAVTLHASMLRFDKSGELGDFLEYIRSESRILEASRKEVVAAQLLSIAGATSQSEDVPIFEFPLPANLASTLASLLQDLGPEKADALFESMMGNPTLKDCIGLTWFLRDERRRQADGEGSRPCLSPKAYEQTASRYLAAITQGLPRILYGPSHPAKFFWRALDEDGDLDLLQDVRARLGGDSRLRCLSAASELRHWVILNGSLQDGYGPDPDDGEEPLFDQPSPDEIETFAKSATYRDLPAEMRSRIAALYLIVIRRTADPGGNLSANVMSEEAQVQASRWISGEGHGAS